MNGDELREAFLSYFESKGHSRAASSSLIPIGDPTLLLTTAGMVQFKPYFAGQATPPNKRMTTSQKCFRTVDIDYVGDATHLTLFEMLGNFSFGDYFKKEAIEYALEFVINKLSLDKDRCLITIYVDDDESFDLWVKAGIPAERIHRFGAEENWWGPAGNEGACGPDSEVHYDTGPDRGCGKSNCGPNCPNLVKGSRDRCDRFVEIWNLVFMQYHQQPDGTRTPLPSPGVDTGMGLERVATILQGVETIYETDLFRGLIRTAEELAGKTYGEDTDADYAMRVLADHGRGAAFLIADGVVPGNEGRGYVLRRIIRRAIRHGRRLGLEGPMLGPFARQIIDSMDSVYPELRNHEAFVMTVLRLEEERFQQAYQTGYGILEDAMKGTTSLSGEVVFKLWDTYGFPVEMTQEIAREIKIEVDLEGFEREMKAQRERARAATRFGDDQAKIHVYESLGVGATEFVGWDRLLEPSVVVGLVSDNQVVPECTEGQDVEVVLVRTPFYPEGGGQVGDAGQIVGPTGKVEIHDTKTVMEGLIIHFGKVTQGSVALGDTVDSYVDPVRREDTARNHTSTHLLHAALRQILGAHVRQAGSLVAPDRLRFDFTHVQPMTEQELRDVQRLVNEKIRQDARVLKDEDSYTSAIQRGALAFFGDKYADRVRLIEIANGDSFSFEVCGGTHVGQTGEVGSLYILSESSIGSGIRRIEAVSGRGAENVAWQRFSTMESLSRELQIPHSEIEERVQKLIEENAELRREKESLERRFSLQSAESLLEGSESVNGVTVVAARATASSVEALREIGDWLRNKLGSGVVVLGSVVNDRPVLVAMVTDDLIASGLDATKIAKGAAKAIGGGGGGRPDVAQAGGRLPKKLDEALSLVPGLVRKMGAES